MVNAYDKIAKRLVNYIFCRYNGFKVRVRISECNYNLALKIDFESFDMFRYEIMVDAMATVQEDGNALESVAVNFINAYQRWLRKREEKLMATMGYAELTASPSVYWTTGTTTASSDCYPRMRVRTTYDECDKPPKPKKERSNLCLATKHLWS